MMQLPTPTRHEPAQEEHAGVRIKDGTLFVHSDKQDAAGVRRISLEVTVFNEVRMERALNGHRLVYGERTDAKLADQLRKYAIPLMINPEKGIAEGVDYLLASAERLIALNPALTVH